MKSTFLSIIIIFLGYCASAQDFLPPDPKPKNFDYLRIGGFLWLDTNDTTGIDASRAGILVFRKQPGDTSLYVSNGAQFVQVGKDPDLSAYYTKTETDNLFTPQARTLNMVGGDDMSITGGTQSLNANRTWTFNVTSTLQSVLDRNNITTTAIITNIGPTPQGQNHYALNNGGVNRIGLGLINTESGGNTGSNFYVSRYDDAGNSTGFPLIARRTDGRVTFETTPYVNNNPIWHAGNQGPGTGMDADLLDGQHGSYYLNFTNATNKPGINTVLDVDRVANDANEYTIIGNVSIGKSATGYGTVGYGFVTTGTTNTYNYANSDVAVMADFLNGHFNIRTAPVGTMGNPITFVDRLKVNNTGSVDVRGTSASVGSAFTVSNSSGSQLLSVNNNGTIVVNGLTYATGSGSPEGSITAPVGSWYSDLTNGVPYFKKTGSGNTGWKEVTLAP